MPLPFTETTPQAPENLYHDTTAAMNTHMPKPPRPESYNGQRDFMILSNWLFSIDIFLAASTNIPENLWVTYIANFLKGEALLWFRATYGNTDLTTVTWRHLRVAIEEYFAPPNQDRRLQDEWANLRQTGPVNLYVSYIVALAMQIPSLTDAQILDKFIRGLKPKTRIEVELRDPQTPQEAYRLADRFDRIVYGASTPSFLSKHFNYTQQQNYGGPEPMQIDTLRTSQRQAKQPQRLSDSERQKLRASGTCFRCRKLGHIAVDCPEFPSKNFSRPMRSNKLGKGMRQ
jgi:hypothetical protein